MGLSYSRIIVCGLFFLANLSFLSIVGCGPRYSNTPPMLDENIPIAKPRHTNQEYINGLYQQFKDVKEILEKHGIQYWMDGGPMMGALRHVTDDGRGGFIPWDDDVDLSLAPGEEDKLFRPEVQKDFDDAGYRVAQWSDLGYGIWFKDGRAAPVKVDLFTTVEMDGKIFFKIWNEGSREGGRIYYKKEEIYPLKRYKFGPEEFGEVYGPRDPEPYLIWTYGYHWKEWGIQTHLHHDAAGFRRVRIKIDDESRKPALPNVRLKNRIGGI